MGDVIKMAGRMCQACRAHKHTSCWQKYADLLDDEDRPCKCGCWDGKETSAEALADAMRHHPDYMARLMRFRAGQLFMCTIDDGRSRSVAYRSEWLEAAITRRNGASE